MSGSNGRRLRQPSRLLRGAKQTTRHLLYCGNYRWRFGFMFPDKTQLHDTQMACHWCLRVVKRQWLLRHVRTASTAGLMEPWIVAPGSGCTNTVLIRTMLVKALPRVHLYTRLLASAFILPTLYALAMHPWLHGVEV